MFMVPPAVLSNFFEKQWTQNHPQYLSGLSRTLYPTTFLEIAVYKRCKSVLQLECFTSHLSSIFLSSAKIAPPLRKSFSKRTVWISKHFSKRFDVALTSFWSDKINLNHDHSNIFKDLPQLACYWLLEVQIFSLACRTSPVESTWNRLCQHMLLSFLREILHASLIRQYGRWKRSEAS